MAEAKIKIGAAIAEYQQAMRQAAAEMKKVSSEYSLAAANAKLYGTQSDVLRAKVTELTKKLELQKGVVEQNRTQHGNLTAKLEDQQKKQESLRQKVQAAEQAYRESAQATGEHSEETEKLKLEYEKLEAQLESSDRQIGKTKASITNQEAAVTQSEAALKQLELQLRDVNEELARQKFDEYAEKANKAGDAVTDAGKKMAVVTGAITAVGGASVKTAAGFETQMSKVQAISGATAEEMDTMSESARYWGSNSKFSASEAASAFEYMALAGWKTEESVSAMEGILNLAAATDMELAKASDVVTDYLSAFSMEASQATTVADLMTFAQGNSNTSAEQLAEAYKNCAANANAMGYDIQQTTGMLGIMANQGLKGSEAGTALTAVFRDMTAKMKDGAIAIGDTTIQVVDANGNYRQMTDILKEVEAATDGMGDAEKNAALMSTFTADSVKGLNLLLNAGSREVGDFTAQLYDCSGSAKDTAAVMQDNLQGQLTSLQSKIEGVSISIGNILLPYVKDAVGWFSNLVDRFAGLDEGAQKAIVAAGAVVAAIGPLLLAAGKLVKFSASVSSGLGTLSAALAKAGFGAAGAGTSTGAFSTILAAITSPVGIAVAAIAAVVAGMGYVAATNEDVRNSLMDVWRTFTANLQPILEYISGTVLPDMRAAWGSLMQMLRPLADFVKDALTSAWQDILIPALEWIAGTVLPNVADTMRNLWENVMRPLGGFIGSTLAPIIRFLADTLTDMWQNAILPVADAIGGILASAWDGLYSVLNKGIIPAVRSVIEFFTKHKDATAAVAAAIAAFTLVMNAHKIALTASAVAAGVMTTTTTLWTTVSGIATAATTALGAAVAFLTSPVTLAAAAIAALIGIGVLLYKNWDTVSAKAQEIWGNISSFFSGIWNEIYTTVSTWLNGIWQSVSDVFNSCWEVVRDVWQAIRNVVQVAVMFIIELFTASFSLITAPFRFIWENCKDTVMSIWEGIKDTVSTAIDAVKTILETVMHAIAEVLDTIWNAISTTVGNVWNGICSTITTVANAIKYVLETVWNAISSTIANTVNKIRNTISSVFNAVKSTVTSIWNSIKSTTVSVWNNVKSAVATPINAARSAVSSAVNGIKSTVSSVFNSVRSAVASTWNSIKNAIATPINAARDTVREAIERIKSFFNFTWSLPHLKLPHPKISGSFSLNPPSVPHFSLEWYRNGGIMTGPTLFGGSGTALFAGGEAGDEAILPLAPFYEKLNDMLDRKMEAMQRIGDIYVESHTYIDGEEISNQTVTKVDAKMTQDRRKGR